MQWVPRCTTKPVMQDFRGKKTPVCLCRSKMVLKTWQWLKSWTFFNTQWKTPYHSWCKHQIFSKNEKETHLCFLFANTNKLFTHFLCHPPGYKCIGSNRPQDLTHISHIYSYLGLLIEFSDICAQFWSSFSFTLNNHLPETMAFL